MSWKSSHICKGRGDINLCDGTIGQRKSSLAKCNSASEGVCARASLAGEESLSSITSDSF